MISKILHFWFEEHGPKQWYTKDDAFDRLVEQRFASVHRQATQVELFDWRVTPEGRLAEIILLDQFSRNLFRDSAQAFAYDGMALILAQETIRAGADRQLENQRRAFVYLPFMHSESPAIHEQALKIFQEFGDANSLDYELRHKQIIDRFGRYPHRNAVLGRESTAEEIEFLRQPGSSF